MEAKKEELEREAAEMADNVRREQLRALEAMNVSGVPQHLRQKMAIKALEEQKERELRGELHPPPQAPSNASGAFGAPVPPGSQGPGGNLNPNLNLPPMPPAGFGAGMPLPPGGGGVGNANALYGSGAGLPAAPGLANPNPAAAMYGAPTTATAPVQANPSTALYGGGAAAPAASAPVPPRSSRFS
tara:strand:- start:146 stop:703 length:558 start_codon:yes stop_codon:yes gene_type:complete